MQLRKETGSRTEEDESQAGTSRQFFSTKTKKTTHAAALESEPQNSRSVLSNDPKEQLEGCITKKKKPIEPN
jgi:hypothetical protein